MTAAAAAVAATLLAIASAKFAALLALGACRTVAAEALLASAVATAAAVTAAPIASLLAFVAVARLGLRGRGCKQRLEPGQEALRLLGYRGLEARLVIRLVAGIARLARVRVAAALASISALAIATFAPLAFAPSVAALALLSVTGLALLSIAGLTAALGPERLALLLRLGLAA